LLRHGARFGHQGLRGNGVVAGEVTTTLFPFVPIVPPLLIIGGTIIAPGLFICQQAVIGGSLGCAAVVLLRGRRRRGRGAGGAAGYLQSKVAHEDLVPLLEVVGGVDALAVDVGTVGTFWIYNEELPRVI